jgi:hypothetical protein
VAQGDSVRHFWLMRIGADKAAPTKLFVPSQ